jgi:UPF0716 protein FxsA
MVLRLLLLLGLLPIVEIVLMFEVGRLMAGRIGMGGAVVVSLGEVVFSGLLGAAMARSQGLRAVARIRQSLADGEVPDRALMDAAMIVAGGVLLLLPGYLTDLVGLSLLVPGLRAAWRRGLGRWLRARVLDGAIRMEGTVRASAPESARRARSSAEGPQAGDLIIDVTPEEPR